MTKKLTARHNQPIKIARFSSSGFLKNGRIMKRVLEDLTEYSTISG